MLFFPLEYSSVSLLPLPLLTMLLPLFPLFPSYCFPVSSLLSPLLTRFVPKQSIPLSGDDLYPDKPDFEGLKGLRRMPQTLEEIRGATKRHHRQELKKDSDEPLYVCNVEPRYGLPGPNKKLQQIKYAF